MEQQPVLAPVRHRLRRSEYDEVGPRDRRSQRAIDAGECRRVDVAGQRADGGQVRALTGGATANGSTKSVHTATYCV